MGFDHAVGSVRCRKHTVGAVEATGGRLGVHVRTEQDERGIRGEAVQAELVADPVDLNAEAALFQPAAKPVALVDVGFGHCLPVHTAAGGLPEAAHGGEVCEEFLGVRVCGHCSSFHAVDGVSRDFRA